ncbi:rod-binding protein [Aceticella autotrophica]|nr:rod-binding protein [Aceticella autotrophica]
MLKMEVNPLNGITNIPQISSQNNTIDFKKAIQNALNEKNKEKLKKECKELESQFVGIMLNEMKKTIPKDPITGDDFATDVFTSMLYDKYAEAISEKESLGLADTMYKQLSKNI